MLNRDPHILRFVDLFAGRGGFHQALSSLGHKCVLSCEIEEELRELYQLNFGQKPFSDIRALQAEDVPSHDILCAGFPCQPFSKAGDQQGFECQKSGDLIDYVIRILRAKKPEFLLLENVPNLVRHRNGATWKTLAHRLRLAGYTVDYKILSPHQFGVPHRRDRVIIVGQRSGLTDFEWPQTLEKPDLSIASVLDQNPNDAKRLSSAYQEHLDVWQQFLDLFPKTKELPSFPIWAMEFGATYPYEHRSPSRLSREELSQFKGAFGCTISTHANEDLLKLLPSYAQGQTEKFPKWKVDFIRQNRELYEQNRHWIDQWLPRLSNAHPSFQKFEWNCKGEKRVLRDYVIQFRASGIRVKRPTMAPSLVAMTTSQVPVIAWEGRYMTARECSRLQSMGQLNHLPDNSASAFKALGNAVNVEVIRQVAAKLLGTSTLTTDQNSLLTAPNEFENTRVA